MKPKLRLFETSYKFEHLDRITHIKTEVIVSCRAFDDSDECVVWVHRVGTGGVVKAIAETIGARPLGEIDCHRDDSGTLLATSEEMIFAHKGMRPKEIASLVLAAFN